MASTSNLSKKTQYLTVYVNMLAEKCFEYWLNTHSQND